MPIKFVRCPSGKRILCIAEHVGSNAAGFLGKPPSRRAAGISLGHNVAAKKFPLAKR
jgi:hypothetical protein